jgi:hypothetical protein
LVIDYNDGVRGMGPYSNGDHIWIVDNNQHYIFTLMYSAPANVPCGAQSTITIALNSNGTNIGTNTSTVNLVNQTATYNSYLCENSTYTYILSQNGNMGSIAANGEYIWSLSTTQTGWEINGHSAPYTLPSSTATYVSIKTPSSGPAGNATLTVNGANMCGTFSETITTDLPEPTFSYVYSSVCVGQAVTWTIKPVPCATSYTWSADNSDVSLSPDGLSCTIAGMKAGFSSVHVVAKNSYTTGSPLAWTIRVIAGNDPIHCNGK